MFNPDRLTALPTVQAVKAEGLILGQPAVQFTLADTEPPYTLIPWPLAECPALIPLPGVLGAVFLDDLAHPNPVAYLIPAHLCAAVSAALELHRVPVGLEA